ncbi:uncharacterized protein [Physcomitrium patens]|uniref:DUF7734 domain-containing protein n=1 Tax=Physcomitrium patens TaxID=3218 RepID=A0A2K1J9W8_PHYPA|nr:uncharacterized protein LOC112293250 [Physcomitrium patens]PNR38323.1 hypothetical protein PHYPA_021434 [Physcomitrium patens]|eukprot:XP_024398237.1 uncharacterized protein LOC112293250 [Physcomitrella patens]
MASSLLLLRGALPVAPPSPSPPSPLPSPPALLVCISAFRSRSSLSQFGGGAAWRPVCREKRLPRASNGDNAVKEGDVQNEDVQFDVTRMERYTERVPNEVLRVHAVVDGEEDQVIIFKGFSSSLMRPTPDDPAELVLPATATIRGIDRIRGPFNPTKVLLIRGGKGLTWQQFQTLLEDKGC